MAFIDRPKKSTTLSSALGEIEYESTKTIAVEDPGEHQRHGIRRIRTHAETALTFAGSLRSIRRHIRTW